MFRHKGLVIFLILLLSLLPVVGYAPAAGKETEEEAAVEEEEINDNLPISCFYSGPGIRRQAELSH